MKNLPAHVTLIRWALTVAAVVLVWLNSHWSVALAISLISFSIEGLSAAIQLHAKIIKAQERGIQAAMQSFDKQCKQFSDFVASINHQAEAVKKEMNRCRECEMHGQHGIRPGSIHNRSAENCLMKHTHESA